MWWCHAFPCGLRRKRIWLAPIITIAWAGAALARAKNAAVAERVSCASTLAKRDPGKDCAGGVGDSTFSWIYKKTSNRPWHDRSDSHSIVRLVPSYS